MAIGAFDGVHLGHRAVIGDCDTVLTFEPHPSAVVAPAHAPKLLTPLAIKARSIAGLGVEELIVIPFDADFAARSARGVHRRRPRRRARRHPLSGRRELPLRPPRRRRRRHARRRSALSRRGSSRCWRSTGRSSRRATSAGSSSPARSTGAARLLGAPFELRGEVVTGDRRGRELGFPTANLVPDPAFVRPATASTPPGPTDARQPSSIGVRPTFGSGRGELIEAYLLDFDGDLYGHELQPASSSSACAASAASTRSRR